MRPSCFHDRPELPNRRGRIPCALTTDGGCVPSGNTSGPSSRTPSFLYPAAAWGRAHVKALWNSLLHQSDVRDQADGPAALCQRSKNLDHLIQRARPILGVEAPEAFIEKSVHPDLARKALDHIS